MKLALVRCGNGYAGAALAFALLVLNSGCMSYTVKGGRPPGTPGKALEQRFTVTKIESAASLDYGPGAFEAAKGMDCLNTRRDELSAILCKERPDLFVECGGIPFGVVATMGGLQDWPGGRFGTLALYVVTLGCWPASLEEHVPGVAYLYAPHKPERALSKTQLMCGYKCNLSVFTPLGLIPGLNGITGCQGPETTGSVSPAPDSKRAAPIFLTEIARAIADTMTPTVQNTFLTHAKGQPGEDGAERTPPPSDGNEGKEGQVNLIGGPKDMNTTVYFFVNGDESRPAPLMVGAQPRASFTPGTYIFATMNVLQPVTITVTARTVTKTPGIARIVWKKTPVRVEAGKVTVVTVTGSTLEASTPMPRNDAEMYKIRFWSRATEAGALGNTAH